MQSENERRLILEMIQNGKITADEGLRLLKALDEIGGKPATLEEGSESLAEAVRVENLAALPGDAELLQTEHAPVASAAYDSAAAPAAGPDDAQVVPPQGQPGERHFPPEMKRWRSWWILPLWVGVAVTVLAALWMFRSMQVSGVGFIFFCASIPFLLGLALIVVAWQSRTARWLHLRVWQKKGEWPEKISISFPLPLGLASWGLRNFKHKIPGLENTSVDELIQALDQSATANAPFYVEVEDDEDGERVQVYIG